MNIQDQFKLGSTEVKTKRKTIGEYGSHDIDRGNAGQPFVGQAKNELITHLAQRTLIYRKKEKWNTDLTDITDLY